jgi:hypothetical protein
VVCVSVAAEVTAPQEAADIAAADSVAAPGTRLRCPDPPGFQRRSPVLAVADLPVGLQVCVRPMAICPHQVFDPAQDSAVGPAAQESQRFPAARDQALALAHRPVFDPAGARFQPAA